MDLKIESIATTNSPERQPAAPRLRRGTNEMQLVFSLTGRTWKAIILTSRQSLTGCAKGLSAFTLNVLLRQDWPGGTNFFLLPNQLRRARRTLCREGDFPGRDGWFRALRRPARFFADNEGGAGTPPSWPW